MKRRKISVAPCCGGYARGSCPAGFGSVGLPNGSGLILWLRSFWLDQIFFFQAEEDAVTDNDMIQHFNADAVASLD